MRYPSQFLDQLKQHFRISDIVSNRVALKRSGREFMGLCPFHNEKTPSFTVNDEKEFYHCFGCGAHGDIFKFVSETENISFAEAIEKLASEAGMSLPKLSDEQKKEMAKSASYHEIMKMAEDWFTNQLYLLRNDFAMRYVQDRGISDDIIKHFKIGYAPDQRDGLKTHLMNNNVSESDMLTLGLLSKPDSGASYDKFRSRIIIPILDLKGRTIAFGGRLLEKHPRLPKYLNSPDTPLFHKGRMLYNAQNARKPAYDNNRIIVAEGYMDVIAMSKYGFAETVAPLGTAITPEQIALLWKIADEPIICLDGDEAGKRAMIKASMLAIKKLQPGKSVKFCNLPQGEDPDSILQKNGREAMGRYLDSAKPLVDVIWEHYYKTDELLTPEAKAAAESNLLKVIDTIEHGGVKNYYRKEIKDRLFKASFAKGRNNKNYSSVKSKGKISNIAPPPLLQKGNNTLTEDCHITQLSLILAYPGLLLKHDIEDMLVEMSFKDNDIMQLVGTLIEKIEIVHEIHYHNDFINAFSDDETIKNTAITLINKAKNNISISHLIKQYNDEHEREAYETIKMLESRLHDIELANHRTQAAGMLKTSIDEDSFKHFIEVNEATTRHLQRADYYGEDG